jgi:membrane-associated protein
MFDTESLINYGGLFLLFIIVYIQIGFFFCFFLPGGGFMFTAGVLIATGGFNHNFFVACSWLIIATILGNITGYWFGWKAGPLLHERNDNGFFRRQHLETAGRFYKKHGSFALIAGVFLPLIRTFAPIVSGVIRVNFYRFFLFTGLGSIGYVVSFMFAGYLIGSMPFLKPYLKYLVITIVALVTIPIVVRIIREFRKK